MTTQKVWAIRCVGKNCPDYIFLPPQSLLGKFDDRPYPSKEMWPLTYLCKQCGCVSEYGVESIRLEDTRNTDRNRLVEYQFSNGRPESLVIVRLYTKEAETYSSDYETHEEVIERILKPSALWPTNEPLCGIAMRTRILMLDNTTH